MRTEEEIKQKIAMFEERVKSLMRDPPDFQRARELEIIVLNLKWVLEGGA